MARVVELLVALNALGGGITYWARLKRNRRRARRREVSPTK